MYVTVVSEMAEELSQVTGIPPNNCDAYLTNRISHAEILTALGNDVVGIGSTAPSDCPTKTRSDGFRVGEWGFVYRPVPHAFGICHEIVERPLKGIASAKELTHYRVPDPYTSGRFDVAQEHSERYGQDHALLGVIECTVFFEMAWNLVGLEQFLTDMALRKDYVEPLLDEVTNYSIGIGLELIRLGADITLTGDDVGMDPGLMMSLSMWRKYLKPRLKRVFDAYKAAKPDIILAYYTCGSMLPFIDELIEMGMEVLNPIQVTAHGMAPPMLKKNMAINWPSVAVLTSVTSYQGAHRKMLKLKYEGGSWKWVRVEGTYLPQPTTSKPTLRWKTSWRCSMPLRGGAFIPWHNEMQL